jgi:hypothetical protein
MSTLLVDTHFSDNLRYDLTFRAHKFRHRKDIRGQTYPILRIYYPIHIQAQKKDIISYHYHGNKKDMDIHPISFASIVKVSEQQKARQKSSTFYQIELKP